MSIPIVNQRYRANEAFRSFRLQAVKNTLRDLLSGKQDRVLNGFADKQALHAARTYQGIQPIPTRKISGSVSKNHEFDQSFRPLRNHTRDRWTAALIAAREDGWPPIRAYKLGEDYFVEDGHHRVSVANYLGMDYIDGEVWEYKGFSLSTTSR